VSITLLRVSLDGTRFVSVRVTDTGHGIDLRDQANLFKAFTQLDASSARVHEGTGLGLYVSQRLANFLGGRIGHESELGKGSAFTLFVPAN
jgi:signal transduction histidine kinase